MTRYEENFKMIVELNQAGHSVRRLVKEYGLSEATIYKWKNLYLPNQPTGLTGKEVAELIKETARLKEELEILKKPQPYSLEKPKVTCSIHRKMV